MWFLNQETGCIWEVTDKELMLRLQANNHYEQVNEPKRDEAEQELSLTKVQAVKNMKRTEKAQLKKEQEPVHE